MARIRLLLKNIDLPKIVVENVDANETNEDSGGVPYDLLIFLSLFRSGTTYIFH